MKVLQTLGRHGATQEGIFQYKRTAEGVHIDSAVGQATLQPAHIVLTRRQWTAILRAIRDAPQNTFRLTTPPAFSGPPTQSLYGLRAPPCPSPRAGTGTTPGECTCAQSSNTR